MGKKWSLTVPILWILSLASLLLTPFLIQVVFVNAAPETIVKVEPYKSSVNVTETFTVNITVIDVQNLYGIDITLQWNPAILEAVNIDVRLGQTDGVLHNPIYTVKNSTQKGKYVLAALSMTPAPPFDGNGSIVRIAFNVTNCGNSTIDLETELYDYPPPDREPRVSWPIEHVTTDGVFTEIPEFPDAIIILLFMAVTFFAVVFSRKAFRKTRPMTV